MYRKLSILFLLGLFSTKLSLEQPNCPLIPALKIWNGMTNQQVEQYLETKYGGGLQSFLDHLAQQLDKIQSI
jgi:hypothetical protein